VKRVLQGAVVVLVLGGGALLSLWWYGGRARKGDEQYHSGLQKTIQLTSDSFRHEEEMPGEFTCKVKTVIAPHMRWAGAPAGTRSYALVATDWDAPSPHLRLIEAVHWVLFNIPVDTTEIPRNATHDYFVEKNISQGLNINGRPGYAAPCPPIGTHRYEFRVYALDVDRLQPSPENKPGLINAMHGHILAYGELVGLSSS
jgi:Raf kinase inhibitor-like YbhB/YbcL family protein